MRFDPKNPDLPFPGIGLLEIGALCRGMATLGETDRGTLLGVARQAEAWQRRSARLALAGAEVSKALADVVSSVGTNAHPQAVHQLGWAVGDYLCHVSGVDPAGVR